MDFTLESGRVLTVSMASFEDGNALRKAIYRCREEHHIPDFSSEDSIQILLCDDKVEEAIFACAKAAIYAGAKVNRNLFDEPVLKEDARADYFQIVSKIMEVNLKPFFRKVSSASSQQSIPHS